MQTTVVELPKATLMLLDSGAGKFASGQLDWLDKQLDLRPGKPALVFAHFNALSHQGIRPLKGMRDGDGAAILVDAGGSMGGGVDPGRRVIVPGLARLGVRRLDVVMVSHADADHIAGMAEVILATRPREVWWQAPEDGGELGRAVLEAAHVVGAKVVAPPVR